MNIHDFPEGIPAAAQPSYPRQLADELIELSDEIATEPNLAGRARHEPRAIPISYDPEAPITVRVPDSPRTPADHEAEARVETIPESRWQELAGQPSARPAATSGRMVRLLGKIARQS
jgi:hypothetical protein